MINELAQHVTTKMEGRMPYDASYLRDFNVIDAVSYLAIQIREASNKGLTMVDICSAVGSQIRKELELPIDGVKSFRGGFFILHCYADLELIDISTVKRKDDKHPTYYVYITDWPAMQSIWEGIDFSKTTWTQPSLVQPAPWIGPIHESGDKIIRSANKDLIKSVTPETHEMLYSVLNRKQATAYVVNQNLLTVFRTLLKQNASVFGHTNALLSREKQQGKLSEAKAVLKSADYVGTNKFYHIYNFDFRGRIYPTTGYFHEQSSDHAKSLIQLADKQPLGEDGYNWLLYSAASNWGEDKLPTQDRIQFAYDNLDNWLSWATDPINSNGWFDADKPWAFLGDIMEILKAQFCPDKAAFESGHVVYFDGSTNGSQHLTALAKDETIASHVNLVPTDKPGDLYTLIANASFKMVAESYNPGLDDQFQQLHKDLTAFRKEIETVSKLKMSADVIARIKDLWANIKAYREDHKDLIAATAPNFWMQEGVSNKQRKIAKRNVMTLGYGSEAAGFSDQLEEDCQDILDCLKYMDRKWSYYMAKLNYDNCLEQLPGPASMLKLFKDLAIRANRKGQHMAWTAPITNFPVQQSYYEIETTQVTTQYKGRRLQPRVALPEQKALKKSKQKSGASPNVVHSFDAAHLTMTCDACDFQTVTIHDSFGTAAGNATDLYHIVREQWVEFYNADPLVMLLTELDALDLLNDINIGTLDHNLVLDSQFAFA